MFWVDVVAVLVLGFATAAVAKQNSSLTEKVTDILHEKCLKNANESIYRDVEGALNQLSSCWGISLPSHNTTGEELYSHCMNESTNFSRCLKECVEEILPCLDPQEKYLQQMILRGFARYDHHFCTSLKTKNNEDVINCSKKVEDDPKKNPLLVCSKATTVFGENLVPDIIRKSAICSDILYLRMCYEETYDRLCSNPESSKQLGISIISQLLATCY